MTKFSQNSLNEEKIIPQSVKIFYPTNGSIPVERYFINHDFTSKTSCYYEGTVACVFHINTRYLSYLSLQRIASMKLTDISLERLIYLGDEEEPELLFSGSNIEIATFYLLRSAQKLRTFIDLNFDQQGLLYDDYVTPEQCKEDFLRSFLRGYCDTARNELFHIDRTYR